MTILKVAVDELLAEVPLVIPFLFGLLAPRGHRWFAVVGLAPALAVTIWSLVSYSGDTNQALIVAFFVLVGLFFWAIWSACVGLGLLLRRFLSRSRSRFHRVA